MLWLAWYHDDDALLAATVTGPWLVEFVGALLAVCRSHVVMATIAKRLQLQALIRILAA
jgi:hypothetical protein